MLIMTQNKECIFLLTELKYLDQGPYHHAICIPAGDGGYGGWLIAAEYESKARCLEVLNAICVAYEEECYTKEVYDSAAQATIPATYRNNTVFELPEK
jgi:hypothetical protein